MLKTPDDGSSVPVVIVGRSQLFPVAAAPKAFWPNLLGLKGLMAGLASAQWPFTEFLTVQDLTNLKGFVMQSGLLASGGLPAEGFEIPPEVLKASTVLPLVALFLAKQALEDARSFQGGGIAASRVRVVLEGRAQAQRALWLQALGSAGLPDELQRGILEAVARLAAEATPTEHPSCRDVASLFARHYGFEVGPVDASSPLPGALSWITAAVRALQDGQVDLVIAGSADGVHSLRAWTDDPTAAEATPGVASDRYREGLGMFALRRLADAERDGDKLYGHISDVDGTSVGFVRHGSPTAATLPPEPSAPPPAPAQAGRLERLARFARLPEADIVEDGSGGCLNLPFNSLPADGSQNASLEWSRLRDSWVRRTGSHRFFHDLLGALCGTFVSRVVVKKPEAFAAVATQPLIFLANHQIGLESPLFMAVAYAMTGVPIQAVAKPDHVDAWLTFLLDFAQDSLGEGHPFRLLYLDRQNPLALIDTLKKAGRQENSLLVHIEGTRGLAAGEPVTKLSSIFLDLAIDKDIPIVPVRFAGGLPRQPVDERLDFPFDNGKQDYLIGAPLAPAELKRLPYGRRPRFALDQINALVPDPGADVLLPPDPAFGAKTRFFAETFGFPKMQAMLFAILQLIDHPCRETALLIEAVKSGKIDAASGSIPPVLRSFLSHVKTKFKGGA